MYFGNTPIVGKDYEKEKLDNLFYQWNIQQDFNEWFDDVYILHNKDAGVHTMKELWDMFNKYQDELETEKL